MVADTTPVLVHNCSWEAYGRNSADAHYDKHVLGMDDDGNFTRRPDMPEYDDEDGGFERFVADSQALICSDTCPVGVKEGTRTDGALVRYDPRTGQVGMRRNGKIVTFFRPDDPAAYFENELAR